MSGLPDRQAAASRQGSAFEETVVNLLQIEGWTIEDRNYREPIIDVEIDIVATDPRGQRWWVECKGSWESPTRNGLQRTDTLKKAIANGALLRLLEDPLPYMVITSHVPESGAGAIWLERATKEYVDEFRMVGFTNTEGTP
jgi:hypothetical protein